MNLDDEERLNAEVAYAHDRATTDTGVPYCRVKKLAAEFETTKVLKRCHSDEDKRSERPQ